MECTMLEITSDLIIPYIISPIRHITAIVQLLGSSYFVVEENKSINHMWEESYGTADQFVNGDRKNRNCLIIVCCLFCYCLLVWCTREHHRNPLFFTLLYGYSLINIITLFVVQFTCGISWVEHKTNWTYFIKGMRGGVISMLFRSALLLLWSPNLPIDETDQLGRFMMSSLVTLVVMAVLRVLMTPLPLILDADAVHGRFGNQISSVYGHVSLLASICSLQGLMEFGIQVDGIGFRNLHEIKQCACIINSVSKVFRNTYDRSHLFSLCEQMMGENFPDNAVTVDKIRSFFGIDIALANIVHSRVRMMNQNVETITYADFQQSVLRAYGELVELDQTLSNAMKSSKSLRNYLNSLRFVIGLIVWMVLLTNGQSESPVLFVFTLLSPAVITHNTCQNIFQGIIFVLVNRPFYVGDRCIIESGIQLQVKCFDIMTTRFTQIGDESYQPVYPNEILASKGINMIDQRW